MGRLNGRVAIVTGAGRGLGRCHALALAQEGAAVVVNDLGGDLAGQGADLSPAAGVVAEIRSRGGAAVVSGHDVADWDQSRELVELAVREFGRLDVLVNNAGILRDRSLANLSQPEWDAVIRVHLTGTAAPTRHAVAYWRDRARVEGPLDASVVMTSSASGLVGNFGQANYGAAKMGVVALSSIVNLECGRYGVRSNVIAPAASTRMGPAVDEAGAPVAGFEPEQVSPLVAWLAAADCPAAGQVFQVHDGQIVVLAVPTIAGRLQSEEPWTMELLDKQLTPELVVPLTVSDLLGTPAVR